MFSAFVVALAAVLFASRATAQSQPLELITVAGGSNQFGDFAPARQSCLNKPTAVAWHPVSNELLIADTFSQRVRLVAADGTISTIAGNGLDGFGGEGGPAVQASLSFPRGVAWLPDGSVAVSDSNNYRVRRIAADGTISTIVGSGNSVVSGPATGVRIVDPRQLHVHNGTLYIADCNGNRIWAYRQSTGIATLVVGNGTGGTVDGPVASALVFAPHAVAVNASGDGALIIAEWGSNTIRRLHNGILTTIAGTGFASLSGDVGPALQAQLNGPRDVAFRLDGQMVVADANNHRLRRLNVGMIWTLAGTTLGFAGDGGIPAAAQMNYPYGLSVRPSDGAIAIADTYNDRVRLISGGVISTYAGGATGDGSAATPCSFSPESVAVDPADGSVLISDVDGHRIRRLFLRNSTLVTVAGTGVEGLSGDGGPAILAQVASPRGIVINGTASAAASGGGGGEIYFADTNNHRIRRVNGGIISTGVGTPGSGGDGRSALQAQFNLPNGVAVYKNGLLVADTANSCIRYVNFSGSSAGLVTTVAGICGSAGPGSTVGPATTIALSLPRRVRPAFAGGFYVVDSGNQRVRLVAADGVMRIVAGTGVADFTGDGSAPTSARLNRPYDVAESADGSELYISDADNNRVRRIRGGVISTIAGNGATSPLADGEPPAAYAVAMPLGIAIDVTFDGSIYIAEAGGPRIRRVAPIGVGMTLSSAAAVLVSDPCPSGTPSGSSAQAQAQAAQCAPSVGLLYVRGEQLALLCSAGSLSQSWSRAAPTAIVSCNATDVVMRFDVSADPVPWLWQARDVTLTLLRGAEVLSSSNAVRVALPRVSQPPLIASTVRMAWTPSAAASSGTAAATATSPNGTLRLVGTFIGEALLQPGAQVLLSAAGVALPLALVNRSAHTVDARLRYAADAWFPQPASLAAAAAAATCQLSDCGDDALVSVALRLATASGAPAQLVPLTPPAALTLRVPRPRAALAQLPQRIPRGGATLPAQAVQLPWDTWTAADTAADSVATLERSECNITVGSVTAGNATAAAASAAAAASFTVRLPICPSGDASSAALPIPPGLGIGLPLYLVLGGGLLSVPLGTVTYAPSGVAGVSPKAVALPGPSRQLQLQVASAQAAPSATPNVTVQLHMSLAAPADDAHLYTRMRIGTAEWGVVPVIYPPSFAGTGSSGAAASSSNASTGSSSSSAAAAGGGYLLCNISLAALARQLQPEQDFASLPVSFLWGVSWLPADGDSLPHVSIPVVARPTVTRVVPSAASAGSELVILGSSFCAGDPTGECSPASSLSVRLGPALCSNATILADFAASCIAPAVSAMDAPATYPLLPLVVTNGAGATARAVLNVTYPSSGHVEAAVGWPLPTRYLPSDPTEPVPLAREIAVSLRDAAGLPFAGAAVCSLTARSLGVLILPLNRTAVDLTAVRLEPAAAAVSGSSSGSQSPQMPLLRFGLVLVQAPFGTGNVTAVVACSSASATDTVSFAPLLIELAPLPLSVAPCSALPSTERSLSLFPRIRLAVLTLYARPASGLAPLASCADNRAWSTAGAALWGDADAPAGASNGTANGGSISNAHSYIGITLPRISCAASASALRAGAAAPIIQDGSAIVSPSSGFADFTGLRLGGEVGEAYQLAISCSIGSIIIPEAATATVTISGCAAGTQPRGSLCEPCASDAFSDGGRELCRHCPRQGVVCSSGLLTAVGGFFRPPAHASRALDGDAELHVCPIPSRCLVNDTASLAAAALASAGSATGATVDATAQRTWFCQAGSTGPLCAACDEAAGYASVAGECVRCGDQGASLLAVVLLVSSFISIVAVITLMKRRAAQRGGAGRSGDSIALRILLTHIQAAGSLRAFRMAASSELFRRATAWLDILSPAVFSQGPTQCVLAPSFAAVYWATLAAPLVACGLSMAILFAVEAAAACTAAASARRRAGGNGAVLSKAATPSPLHDHDDARLSPASSLPRGRRASTAAVAAAVAVSSVTESASILASVWRTGAPASILLVVASLAYMPMVSAALSVFQCTESIDGARYLLADVRVQCQASSSYVAMAAAAGLTLLFVGAGFPALIVWRLRRASAEQLKARRFRAVWSFLYEGYRGPPPGAGSAVTVSGSASAGSSMVPSNSGAVKELVAASSVQNPLVAAASRFGGSASGSSAATVASSVSFAVVSKPASASSTPPQVDGTWWAVAASFPHYEAVVVARKLITIVLARLVSAALLASCSLRLLVSLDAEVLSLITNLPASAAVKNTAHWAPLPRRQ